MRILFVCSGCDFISFFSHLGKATFLRYYFQLANFITSAGIPDRGTLAVIAIQDDTYQKGFLAFIQYTKRSINQDLRNSHLLGTFNICEYVHVPAIQQHEKHLELHNPHAYVYTWHCIIISNVNSVFFYNTYPVLFMATTASSNHRIFLIYFHHKCSECSSSDSTLYSATLNSQAMEPSLAGTMRTQSHIDAHSVV